MSRYIGPGAEIPGMRAWAVLLASRVAVLTRPLTCRVRRSVIPDRRSDPWPLGPRIFWTPLFQVDVQCSRRGNIQCGHGQVHPGRHDADEQPGGPVHENGASDAAAPHASATTRGSVRTRARKPRVAPALTAANGPAFEASCRTRCGGVTRSMSSRPASANADPACGIRRYGVCSDRPAGRHGGA
jgi:hypothetical protein